MFNRSDRHETDTKPRWKRIRTVAFLVNVIGAILLLMYPKRFKKYLRDQRQELTELQTGEEDVSRFLKDSGRLLKDFFIPHAGNDHRPRALRPKSLITYATVALLIKAAATGFLFLTYPTPASLSAIVTERMIELINEARADADVAPLAPNQLLTEAALAKGTDMIDRDYFAHDTPEGKRPWQWLNRTQYDYVYAGENLAMDFVSAEVVQAALMQSPTHRKNIVNAKYREVGIAVLLGELNGRETILLVEFFGTQRKDTRLVTTTGTRTTAQPSSTLEPASPTPVPTNGEQTPIAGETSPVVAGEETDTIAEAATEQALNEPLNQVTIVVGQPQQRSRTMVDRVIEYSNVFFLTLLVFVVITLFLNIVIKIRIQHPAVILQTVAVVALLLALTLVKFHFAEQVPSQLLIL